MRAGISAAAGSGVYNRRGPAVLPLPAAAERLIFDIRRAMTKRIYVGNLPTPSSRLYSLGH
jgi:hypothetical protein